MTNPINLGLSANKKLKSITSGLPVIQQFLRIDSHKPTCHYRNVRAFELASTKAMPSGIVINSYKAAGSLKNLR